MSNSLATTSCPERLRHRRRRLSLEPLEHRRLLVSEGALYTITELLDASGLPGEISATVFWGDGTSTSASVTDRSVNDKLHFKFDYSLDTRGFFSGPNQSRRAVLELAGQLLLSQLTDDLAPISPAGQNRWQPNIRHPSATDSVTPPLHNLSPTLRVAANEIIVYPGSRDFPGEVRAVGGPGGVASFSGTKAFVDLVKSRGETGALLSKPTDFAPSHGSVSFDVDSSTAWYFGVDPNGIGKGQVDFLTVAVHELAHVLGFGVAPSWNHKVSNGMFTGTEARAAYAGSGNVPLSGDHWADLVHSEGGIDPLMSGKILAGQRQLMTAIDFAALDDIGWQVAETGVNVSAAQRYADNGEFPIQISLRGTVGGQLIAERSFLLAEVTVTNVAPDLAVVADQSAIAGQAISITNIGTISDTGFENTQASPATSESFTYTIHWGDGTANDQGIATIDSQGNGSGAMTVASFDGTHTYASAGNWTVTVEVTDDDGATRQQAFQVFVAQPPRLELELNRPVVSEDEGQGATLLTVSLIGDTSGTPTTVNLQSSDPSELRLPETVVIPAAESSIQVPVEAIDDALLDGDVAVTVTASAADLNSEMIDLLVKDHEALTAEFSTDQVTEGAPAGVELTIGRSNTDTSQPLVISIIGGNATEVDQPAKITIPANQQEQTITLFPTDDDHAELPLQLSYTFTAIGYFQAEAAIELLDDEPPLFQNPVDPFDVSGSDGVRASDALRIINELHRRTTAELDPGSEQPGGLYLDVNGDYKVTALDALCVINELAKRNSDGQLTFAILAATSSRGESKVSAFQQQFDPESGKLF